MGLMKIANYHKDYRKDFVWFCKGTVPEKISESVVAKLRGDKYHSATYGDALDAHIKEAQRVIDDTAWDRVYVTTLFTFEWDKTIEAIEYAKTLVGADKVWIGGILATLMPVELEKATGIRPMTGLLTDSATLGYDDRVNIDRLVPDYSILAHTEHSYPMSENYILTATRGCGMKCSFCAVQTLEPECVDYLPLPDMIREIDDRYGERKNLVLMDNNILKSRYFEKIMQDIIGLGYGRGATKVNPQTGRPVNVYVDFNQGLDMNFVTEKKMAQLGKLALRPIRIAFDHISDHEKYIRAIRLAEKYDICHISNYMLYNAEDFKGKGKLKPADTPEDLYNRLRINVELQEEFNARRRPEGKTVVHMYSFPMKFVPLGYRDRQFIGTNWNRKTLTALRNMIKPFHGVVHCENFDYNYGATCDEFYRLLWKPATYIEHRGKLDNLMWQVLRGEWDKLYSQLNWNERRQFEASIEDNVYSVERYLTLPTSQMRFLYLHYVYGTKFLDFLTELYEKDYARFAEVQRYLFYSCTALYLTNLSKLAALKNAARYTTALNALLDQEIRVIPA